MIKCHSKKIILFLAVSFFIFTSGLWLFFKPELFELIPFNKELRILLKEKLVRVDPLPDSLYCTSLESNNVIYVLGGCQDSLEKKFRIAAELYHKGAAKKIFTLSRPGITEYSSLVERNLTNDEWAIGELIDFGVKREDIEFLPIEEGFFGTFYETKSVSSVVFRRGTKGLIAVTAPYHTMRVWLCFSNFLHDQDVDLYVTMSNDNANLCEHIIEYIKLVLYKSILL